MKTKYLIIISLSTIISSCKVKMPLTEKECIIDSKNIITYIKKSKYEELATYMHKYEDYQNHTNEDFKKKFTPLQKALANIDIDKLKSIVKKDSILIDYTASKEYLINININYFTIDNNHHDVPVCEFRYTQEHNDKYYQLTFFDHDYRVRIKAI